MKYRAFHKLTYGLYIITSGSQGKKAGYIANTAFQVTSDPPLLAISCHKKNDTCAIILESGVFAVSVLKKDTPSSLIGEFGFMASSEVDKFRKIKFENHVTGAPVVTDSCIAWFDCRVVNKIDTGTHMLIIGEVLDSEVSGDDDPLTYAWYREKFKMLAPKNAPTYIDKSMLEAEEKAFSVEEVHVPPTSKAEELREYACSVCGFRYDPEEGDPSLGIKPGTPFEELPDDYRCPVCNAPKDYFREA